MTKQAHHKETTVDTTRKIELVTALIEAIQKDILENVPRLPPEWDGHELRRYIADKFEEKTGGGLSRGHVRANHNSKRLAAYRNEVIVRNL